jgi:UDP-N-acetylmuramyl pentapeptide synthase
MTTIPIQTHLVRDDNGVLRLGGLKYIMIVSNHVYHDMDAAALAKQYPSLTMKQIHAGLAYYHENKDELDAELKRRENEADALLDKYAASNEGMRERFEAFRRSKREGDQ